MMLLAPYELTHAHETPLHQARLIVYRLCCETLRLRRIQTLSARDSTAHCLGTPQHGLRIILPRMLAPVRVAEARGTRQHTVFSLALALRISMRVGVGLGLASPSPAEGRGPQGQSTGGATCRCRRCSSSFGVLRRRR